MGKCFFTFPSSSQFVHDSFNKISEYAFCALIFFVPFSSAGIEISFSVLLASFVGRKIFVPDFRFLRQSTVVFLLLFFFFSALSLFNSGIYLSKSVHALIFKWGEYLLLFAMVSDFFLNQPEKISKAIVVAGVSAVIVCFDVFYQLLTGYDLLLHRPTILIKQTFPDFPEQTLWGLTGPFKHYNALGAYTATLLSFTIAFLLQAGKASKKTLALCFLLVLCLSFTFSRGSWLACGIGLVFLSALTRRKKFLLSLLILLALMIALPAIRDRMVFTFTSPYGGSERLEIWRLSLRMISENPFLGKGTGTFMDYASSYSSGLYVRYAHNSYLQIGAETGLLALICFFLFLFSLLFKAVQTFKITKDPLLAALSVSLFSYLVHAFWDNHFYSLQLAILFWTLAGILQARIVTQSPQNISL